MSIDRAPLTTVSCVALVVGGCAWLEARYRSHLAGAPDGDYGAGHNWTAPR